MREYHSKAIRNVAILGHMDCGKTTMNEAFLYLAGAIDKKGEVEKKNTSSPAASFWAAFGHSTSSISSGA